jgi:hypothetical protein
MKGGEGEGAHEATFFCLLTGIIGGNSEFWGGGSSPINPLTGLDKILIHCKRDRDILLMRRLKFYRYK